MENDFESNEDQGGLTISSAVSNVLSFFGAYGWWIVGATFATLWAYSKAEPHIRRWKNDREAARYHKDPDLMVKRMEEIQAARNRQQMKLEADAKLYQQKEKEREEKKRQEFIERNKGADKNKGAGNILGAKQDYLPLTGAGPSGGYRPPKKSKCGGGGCGK